MSMLNCIFLDEKVCMKEILVHQQYPLFLRISLPLSILSIQENFIFHSSNDVTQILTVKLFSRTHELKYSKISVVSLLRRLQLPAIICSVPEKTRSGPDDTAGMEYKPVPIFDSKGSRSRCTLSSYQSTRLMIEGWLI